MERYQDIYHRAAERKLGERNLELLIKDPELPDVAKLGDDRMLAEFTKKVFQSGFVWRVVEQKWPDFEEVFFGFNIEKILMMPEDMLERKASDPKIIRNFNKVKTIKDNAMMIFDVQQDGNSFSQMVADWPGEDIIGLWAYLKKHGSRLGGNTGPYALRTLGKDTFLLSRDVEAYVRGHKIIDGGLQSQKSLKAIQHFFNELQQQSGRSLAELSRLVSYATGDNRVQA